MDIMIKNIFKDSGCIWLLVIKITKMPRYGHNHKLGKICIILTLM